MGNENSENQGIKPPEREPPGSPPAEFQPVNMAQNPMLGVPVALLPAAIIICLATKVGNWGHGVPLLLIFNAVFSFAGSYMILNRPGGSRVVPLPGGFFLAVVFFGLNIVVGALGSLRLRRRAENLSHAGFRLPFGRGMVGQEN